MEEARSSDDKDKSMKKIRSNLKSSIYVEVKKKCFISRGNNSSLIEQILNSNGFERVDDYVDGVKFIWIQTFQNFNWNSFKQGEHCLNHIQGEDFFTTKLQLYLSLKTYEKISRKTFQRPSFYLSLKDYLPLTFNLDDKNDRDLLFSSKYSNEQIWICKPSELNQGKGICLIRNLELFQDEFSSEENPRKKSFSTIPSMKRILQSYISNPLLIKKRKFDIRCYLFISNVSPLIVFYHGGYLRLSIFDFDQSDPNLLTHLTNQCVQKKDPQYKQIKEDTSWTMTQFNDYLNEQIRKRKILNVEENWVFNVLPKKIIRILLNVIESIRMRLKRRQGCFGLYGCDFMIDEQMNVWLIEINLNPALTTNTRTLNEVIPPIVRQTIRSLIESFLSSNEIFVLSFRCRFIEEISLECFEKMRHNEYLFPLKSVETFELIYNEYQQKSSNFYFDQSKSSSISSSSSSKTKSNENPSFNRRSTSEKISNRILFSSQIDSSRQIEFNDRSILPSIHRVESHRRRSSDRSSYGKRTKYGENLVDHLTRNRRKSLTRSTSASTIYSRDSSPKSSFQSKSASASIRSPSLTDLIRSTFQKKFPSLISSTIKE